MMSFCCDNSQIVRKQRDEIILMTKELQEQEKQLNCLHSGSLRYKEYQRDSETKILNLEKVIKSDKNEIKNLKGF